MNTTTVQNMFNKITTRNPECVLAWETATPHSYTIYDPPIDINGEILINRIERSEELVYDEFEDSEGSDNSVRTYTSVWVQYEPRDIEVYGREDFENVVSELVGKQVVFSEGGMQRDGIAHLIEDEDEE